MDYNKYYLNQIGSGNLPVYIGTRYQRGNGLGGIFKNFIRWFTPVLKTHGIPLLKEGAKVLGSEAIKTAANVANDAIAGKEIQDAIVQRAQESINMLSNKAQNVISGGQEQYKKRKRSVTKVSSKTKSKRTKLKDNNFEDILQHL